MIEMIDLSQSRRWDEIVKSFPLFDVYYLSGYVRPFKIHGDGVPTLMYYQGADLRAIYVFMLRQTEISELFDTITPYGYGGILFDGDVNKSSLSVFWKEYIDAMRGMGIVDDFVRYHPVIGNAEPLRGLASITDLGRTVALDLTSPETIWENLTSKKRGKIRKAEKSGVTIHHGQGMELFQQFIPIYNSTMEKDDATGYYFFSKDFYEAIHTGLKDNYEMFYAEWEGKIIMMAIMLFANGQMHYHLSGSILEYRNLEANNLLLYQAALWGCEKGFKTLHLGGGVGSGNDALFEFKKGFHQNRDYQFSIGRQVFDDVAYHRLVEVAKAKHPDFDETTSFFPAYRWNEK